MLTVGCRPVELLVVRRMGPQRVDVSAPALCRIPRAVSGVRLRWDAVDQATTVGPSSELQLHVVHMRPRTELRQVEASLQSAQNIYELQDPVSRGGGGPLSLAQEMGVAQDPLLELSLSDNQEMGEARTPLLKLSCSRHSSTLPGSGPHVEMNRRRTSETKLEPNECCYF